MTPIEPDVMSELSVAPSGLFFSAATGAFYDLEIWPHDLPDDAVAITADDHAALLAAGSAGMVITADEQGAPVASEPPPPSEDTLSTQARRRRDAAIGDVRWLIDRHRDELALGLTPTLLHEDYLLVLEHVQALRDISSQSGFPAAIQWPAPPAANITPQEPA